MKSNPTLRSITARLAPLWARFRRSPLGHGRGARNLAAGAAFVTFAGAGFAWGSWANLCADCPSIAMIQAWEPEQTSKLLAHDGRLFAELGIEQRTEVELASVPPYVAQAVIAIEDKRFYQHGAYDVRALARAVFGKLTGQSLGGGSTVSQQLARNMFQSSIGFDKRYIRKLRELQVAIQLEQYYTKEQILESYLNQIYMGVVDGRGFYGFQAASRGYFGKELAEVNVAEAALLAALLNSPGTFHPFGEPENALSRRNRVISLMADQRYLSEEEEEAWKAFPLPNEEEIERSGSGTAPFFVEEVRRLLDQRVGADLYTKGLRIWTTLDLDMQAAAEEVMANGWATLEKKPGFRHPLYEEFAGKDTVFASGTTPYLQGMFLAMDPADGGVRVMVGGRDFRQSRFNRATQAMRQPGSSFKPIVYTTALAAGIPASFPVDDGPYFEEQVDGTVWIPQNYDEGFFGVMPMREGLRRSINTVAVRVGNEVGIEAIRNLAQLMGIRTNVHPVSASFIGASEVIPIQLLEAYSGFANLGEAVAPRLVTRVEDADGNVLWEPPADRRRVLDEDVARIAVDMLEDVVNAGTGRPGIRVNADLKAEVPAGGKTGTTNDGTDVWFMGFTPNLVAGVWFGMDLPQKMATVTTGGGDASPVWGHFMQRVYYGPDGPGGLPGILPIPDPWPYPPTLIRREVDSRTGLQRSMFCPAERAYLEWFIPGTEPKQLCGTEVQRPSRTRGPRGGGDGGNP